MINSIKVKNLLSFDAKGIDLELKPLNVLIGPNGSGKSNLIEAISLLQAAPFDLTSPIRDVGGISDWLWKGDKTKQKLVASVDATVDYPEFSKKLRHVLSFAERSHYLFIEDERIEKDSPDEGESDVYFFYRYENNHPVLNVKQEHRSLKREDVDSEQSILSQRKDPDQYPEITWLSSTYGKIKLYREWCFGRYAAPRKPQKTDERNDFLSEDSTNLGLVLNSIRRYPDAKKKLLDSLQQLYEGITDYGVIIEAGHVQVFFEENGMNVPATRLSDGTLRYLSLLAVLCHPKPPALICIEEPELGLHPDVLSRLAELLVDASQRTQLIVTTHSETLVDALSDTPESILVCEKEGGATSIRRCDLTELKDWLKKYSLGELWRKGQIGGNRW